MDSQLHDGIRDKESKCAGLEAAVRAHQRQVEELTERLQVAQAAALQSEQERECLSQVPRLGQRCCEHTLSLARATTMTLGPCMLWCCSSPDLPASALRWLRT